MALCTALFGATLFSQAAFACNIGSFRPSITFTYDGQNQTKTACDGALVSVFNYDSKAVLIADGKENRAAEASGLFAKFVGFLAADSGLIGVTSGESSALARQIYGIQVNGQPAVSSVEAFGSRAGSTFRGLGGPSATSDLDLRITLTDPSHFSAVNAEMNEIGTMFQSAKGFPLEPTYVIPGLPPPTLLQTPFIPLKP